MPWVGEHLDDSRGLDQVRNNLTWSRHLCYRNRKTSRLALRAEGLEPERVPCQFATKSRLLIIANELQNLNRNVSVVEDGGHLISFRPPPTEVHAQVKTWFTDREILEWFERHLSLFRELSMRNYIRALELNRAGLDWVDASFPRPLPGRTRLVARLRDETSFRSEDERVQAFVSAGGVCRATYFNHVRRLRAIRGNTERKRHFGDG